MARPQTKMSKLFGAAEVVATEGEAPPPESSTSQHPPPNGGPSSPGGTGTNAGGEIPPSAPNVPASAAAWDSPAPPAVPDSRPWLSPTASVPPLSSFDRPFLYSIEEAVSTSIDAGAGGGPGVGAFTAAKHGAGPGAGDGAGGGAGAGPGAGPGAGAGGGAASRGGRDGRGSGGRSSPPPRAANSSPATRTAAGEACAPYYVHPTHVTPRCTVLRHLTPPYATFHYVHQNRLAKSAPRQAAPCSRGSAAALVAV